jgi:hypothetical protein
MKEFEVTVQFIFECKFTIDAKSKHAAELLAIPNCGAVSPTYQSTITDDWSGNVHPVIKRVVNVEQL